MNPHETLEFLIDDHGYDRVLGMIRDICADKFNRLNERHWLERGHSIRRIIGADNE